MNLYISDVLASLAFSLALLVFALSLFSYSRARSARLLVPACISAIVLALSGMQMAYSIFSTKPPTEFALLMSSAELAIDCLLCAIWLGRSHKRREANG